MSSIKVFLAVFVLGVALALILETLKKRKKRQATVAAATDYVTANETMPTQTGKYRVKEALKTAGEQKNIEPAAKGSPKAAAGVATAAVDPAEADKLPDPFEIDINPQSR